MLTDFATLEAADKLSEAVRLTLNGAQRDFPVVDAGKVSAWCPAAGCWARWRLTGWIGP